MMALFFSKRWPAYALIALATAVVWGHSIKFGFVWDDKYFIRDLTCVRSLDNIPGMFYRLDYQATRPEDFRVYRPIRTAQYALLYSLAGKAEPPPWIYHLANVVWHGATAMMLFAAAGLLLRRLNPGWTEAESKIWAFGIALAFAVHPVVSEVVCWAKSLDDILAAFFTLAALREVLQPDESIAARWRGVLFFALAVYSKVSAIPFVLVLPFLFFKVHRLSLKNIFWRTFPYLVVAMIYVVQRRLVLGRTTQTAPISGSYLQTLVDMLPVALTYFRLLFGVPPFCIDYSYLTGGYQLLSVPVLCGTFMLVLLAVGGLLAWRSRHWKLCGFGLLWTGLFLLPVSNLLPMMQYLAERFLYLPLIGWLMTVAGVLAMLPRKKLIQGFWFGVVLLWAVTAWHRSWIWQDELTLFIRTSRENPHCNRVEDNAVAAIFDLPQIQCVYTNNNGHEVISQHLSLPTVKAAETTFNEALKLYPTNHNLLRAQATLLATAGRPSEALPMFEKVAGMEATNADSWMDCARAAWQAGQLDRSCHALDKVLAMDPTNHAAFSLLFACQWQGAAFSNALETARRWNQVAPDTNSVNALNRVLKRTKANSP